MSQDEIHIASQASVHGVVAKDNVTDCQKKTPKHILAWPMMIISNSEVSDAF